VTSHASIELEGKSHARLVQLPRSRKYSGKVSGAWVFRGTRVPVSAILKNLKHLTPDQLAEEYPSVPRQQIDAVLDFLARSADPVFVGEPALSVIIHAHSAR